MADWFDQNAPPDRKLHGLPQAEAPSPLEAALAPPGENPAAAPPAPDQTQPNPLAGVSDANVPKGGTFFQPSGGGDDKWKPGDDPKKFVNQYIQQTQNRPATDDDYNYWLPKFQAVGGLGTGEYWMHKMTDPGGTGANAGGGGGGGMTGSFTEAPAPYVQPSAYVAPQFTAPSGLTPENDPGYLARMQMGQKAIEGAAAAKGSLLSGGTLKALERYGQDYGSNEYKNIYDRSMQGFQANTGAGQWGYATNLGAGERGYDMNLRAKRGYQQDYWGRLNDLYSGGQAATGATYKPAYGGGQLPG